MFKAVTVVGARPQFIKMAPVSRVIRERAREVVVHTGQHYDDRMSRVFFDELNIPEPDYNLEVGSKLHGAQTGEMLQKIEDVLLQEKPDCVIVYGDTNSTLAGALAAAKLHIPVGHIEAGLRSFNRQMPEEINRVVTDHTSHWLFCPTETARTCLANEGITERVHLSGDVMLDALNYNCELANAKSTIMTQLSLESKSYLLITLHRAENTDNPKRLREIVEALNQIPIPSILPLHPRTRDKINNHGFTVTNPNVKIIDPVGYLDMLQLESHAQKIITDSGGVQKEAFFFEVPCITMRDETEWTETVEYGANQLVGATKTKIIEAIESFNPSFSNIDPVFGDGHAAEKIVDVLVNHYRS